MDILIEGHGAKRLWGIKIWGQHGTESQELQPGPKVSWMQARILREPLNHTQRNWALAPERHSQGLHTIICLLLNLSTIAGKMQH